MGRLSTSAEQTVSPSQPYPAQHKLLLRAELFSSGRGNSGPPDRPGDDGHHRSSFPASALQHSQASGHIHRATVSTLGGKTAQVRALGVNK